MVSVLDFRSGGPGFKPGLYCHVVFFRQETVFHIVSLHPGV